MMSQYTQQLKFRAPEPEDIDVIMSFENEPDMMAVGLGTGPYSRFQIKQYIESNQNDLFADRQIRFMVDHPQDGVVGIADLFSFDPKNGKIEVGIAVRQDRRRMGIAACALDMIAHYCFSLMNIHQIYAFVACDNIASVQLFRRRGFTCEMRLKDWILVNGKYKDVYVMQMISDK